MTDFRLNLSLRESQKNWKIAQTFKNYQTDSMICFNKESKRQISDQAIGIDLKKKVLYWLYSNPGPPDQSLKSKKVLMISVIHWPKSKMLFKCNQLFRPGPLGQMKNGKFDRLELQNFSPLLSKQNLKNGRKMESSLIDFIGEEYDRNVFLKSIGYSKDSISIY